MLTAEEVKKLKALSGSGGVTSMDRYEGAPIKWIPGRSCRGPLNDRRPFGSCGAAFAGLKGTFFSNYSAMDRRITYLFMPLTVMNLCDT